MRIGPWPRLLPWALAAVLCTGLAAAAAGAGTLSGGEREQRPAEHAVVAGRVVAPDSGASFWVYLTPLDGDGRRRTTRSLPRARLEQRERRFHPPFLVVQRGQWVDFVSRDPGYHGLFSLSAGNEFDLGLVQEGEVRSVELRTPGEVEVYCDMHPEMSARILVLPGEHHTQVVGGTYSLGQVPPGRYLIVAWSPAHEAERRTVRLRPGERLTVDFTMRPRRSPESHLGRHGRVGLGL